MPCSPCTRCPQLIAARIPLLNPFVRMRDVLRKEPIAVPGRLFSRWNWLAETALPMLAHVVVGVVAKIDVVVLLAAAADRTVVPSAIGSVKGKDRLLT